ncbi:MAG: ATP-binding cassette domain-containing protein [Cyanobacteria bacterium J06623_7]
MSFDGVLGNRELPVAPILNLERVSLQATIGADLLLREISFSILPGEIVGIVGVSGAGKTSLLRLLNGLVSPHQGKIYLAGKEYQEYTALELRRRLVLAPQEPKLLGMTVIEALSYPLKLQQYPESQIQTEIASWNDRLRIPSALLTKTELQLSLGQRQILAIARALIMKPQILMLDEPTSALDVATAANLLKVLRQLNREENLTILLVNHQLEQMQGICDRLLLLERGSLGLDVPANDANWTQVSQKIFELQGQEAEEWS